jgi:cytochrome c556
MKISTLRSTLCLVAFAATASLAQAETKIETMMKESMKGENSLYKKVALGKGTDADAAKLVAYVKQICGEKPAKGDDASWKAKTSALVKAAEDVAAKKPDAILELQKAGNCKACHSEHKGK